MPKTFISIYKDWEMFHCEAANKATLLFGAIINFSADNGSYSLSCGGEDGHSSALCPQESVYKYEVPTPANTQIVHLYGERARD